MHTYMESRCGYIRSFTYVFSLIARHFPISLLNTSRSNYVYHTIDAYGLRKSKQRLENVAKTPYFGAIPLLGAVPLPG